MWSNNEPQKQSYIVVGEESREAQGSHTDWRAGPASPDSSQILVCPWALSPGHGAVPCSFPQPAEGGRGQGGAASLLKEKLVKVCGTDNWWRQATANFPNCQSVAKTVEVSIVLRCFLWGKLLSTENVAFSVSSGNLNMVEHHHYIRLVRRNCGFENSLQWLSHFTPLKSPHFPPLGPPSFLILSYPHSFS